jgi:hypothetical protein
VGKTMLVRHVLEDVGLERVEGFGVQEGSIAYGPIIDALRMLAHDRPHAAMGDPTVRPRLAALLPELGPSAREVDTPSLLEAIRATLAVAATQRPLAVLLEDMQWADEATLTALPALARGLDAEPLLFLVAYRDDEVPRGHPIRRLRSELRRHQRLLEVALGPMGAEHTAALLEHVLGRQPTASLLDAVIARTGGIPFFVAEVGAALGADVRWQGVFEAAAPVEGQDQDLPLPDSVRDAVLLRVSRLSPEARRVLEVAAVMGRACAMESAMAIAGVDTWPADLLDSGVVIERAPGQMSFRHALVREAFSAEVPWPRRRALHRAAAQRLEADGAPARIVAEHWCSRSSRRRLGAAFWPWSTPAVLCMPTATVRERRGARSSFRETTSPRALRRSNASPPARDGRAMPARQRRRGAKSPRAAVRTSRGGAGKPGDVMPGS